MTNIIIRPTVADDFRNIVLQPYDAPLQETIRENAEVFCDEAVTGTCSLSCEQDGVVVGIGGILPSGESWQLFAPDCRRAMREMVRYIRAAIINHVLTQGEVYAIIEPDRPNAARWAAVLGLHHEEGKKWILNKSLLVEF